MKSPKGIFEVCFIPELFPKGRIERLSRKAKGLREETQHFT